jgi:uncharacterized OB-fold protein
MASAYEKPIPIIDGRSKPWWDAVRRNELLIQSCENCGQRTFPPVASCPRCKRPELRWIPASGFGRIWSWTVFHKAYFPGFKSEIPYAVAIVELNEGPRLWTQIVGLDYADYQIGLPVVAFFDAVTDDLTLVKFKPVTPSI